MTPETTAPRSRRVLLAGALGGLGVWAAAAIGRSSPALADGEIVHVGDNITTAATTTRITNSANSQAVLVVQSDSDGFALVGQGNSGAGVWGTAATGAGVRGTSTSGFGALGASNSGPGVRGLSVSSSAVYGTSDTYVGVYGNSTSGNGVVGNTAATDHAGVVGYADGAGTGVVGASGGVIPAAKLKTGVYGHATQDSSSRGVWGYSPAGYGVYGESSSGRGVQGVATTGIGVRAAASSGVGLLASATTGYALRTDGKVKLDKSAGLATIASGTSSIAVTPGIDLTATSGVIATLNGSAGGSTAVKRVAINATTNVFTIYLTANAIANVKVAWLVIS
jgi:hypothetical protein